MGGLLPVASAEKAGLMSANDNKYANHYIPYIGEEHGSNRTLSFAIPINSSVMLMLTMTRGDGQVCVLFLSICRNIQGIYSATGMAFANQSAAFKSKGRIYYSGDIVYVKFGHYDNGAYQLLSMGGYTTFNGIIDKPSVDGFIEINATDMIVNPIS